MDMKKYSGARFITIADVRDGPIQGQIAVVRPGKFEKPDLVFESGDVLSVNSTNNRTLMKAYGPSSEGWIGQEIEMFLGEIEFQKKMQEAVLVRPISLPPKLADQTKPKDSMDDEIPF